MSTENANNLSDGYNDPNTIVAEDFNPFISIIIPVYNGRQYIIKLLESIQNQIAFDLSTLEVILCDDNSTDNFMELIENNDDINLNIHYCKTKPREHHCPGNTRMDGWHEASGEWIMFVDQDDELTNDALALITKAITENNESHFVFTRFGEYYPDGKEIRHYGLTAITWLHGKAYNRKWLIEAGIDFKENMMSHEDLYFNNQVVDALVGIDANYSTVDQETYRWIYETESASRKVSTGKYNYMELNVDDFVYAGTEVHIAYAENYPDKKMFYRQKMIVCLLHLYYYYEGMLCKNGEKDEMNDHMLDIIRNTIDKIATHFDCSKDDIIKEIYSSPKAAETLRQASIPGIGFFIERHSFVDFMRHVV